MTTPTRSQIRRAQRAAHKPDEVSEALVMAGNSPGLVATGACNAIRNMGACAICGHDMTTGTRIARLIDRTWTHTWCAQ